MKLTSKFDSKLIHCRLHAATRSGRGVAVEEGPGRWGRGGWVMTGRGGEPESIWARFDVALAARKVPEKHALWWARRARHFAKAVPLSRADDVTEERVRAYLARALGREDLKDWQIGQWVDAVHLFCAEVLRLPWAPVFGWEAWKEPHLNFPGDVASHARERLAFAPAPSVERFADTPRPDSGGAPEEIVQRLREEIRTRHYSLRTEQSYEIWVRRFVAFHRGVLPRSWTRLRRCAGT